jgi:hypothetical protein
MATEKTLFYFKSKEGWAVIEGKIVKSSQHYFHADEDQTKLLKAHSAYGIDFILDKDKAGFVNTEEEIALALSQFSQEAKQKEELNAQLSEENSKLQAEIEALKRGKKAKE